MAEERTPSQEERSGVFEGIRGAKSQDPEVAEEQLELTPETTEPEKPASTGETESKKPDEGKPNQDKQRIARLERQLAQIGPWAQFGMAIGNDPEGQRIVEKYQRGEPLFEKEAAYLEQQVQQQQEGTPLTEEKLSNILDQREAGKQLMDELNSIASDELDNYDKIKRNPKFLEFLDFARQSVWQGRTELDEGVLDWQNEMAAKEMTAIKRAYNLYLADNPKVLEAAKRAGQKQEKERREALQSVPTSEGTTTSSQEEPEETSDEEDIIKRMMNAGGGGKSFATIGSKRR